MKVFVSLLLVSVASAASAPSTGPQQPSAGGPQQAGASAGGSQASVPSQVATKRGDSDFTASASQQQPVYSPSLSQQQQQQSSSPQQSASPSDYQASASNSNLYYYYYPANSGGQHKSESDPYQTSAASSYPSYSGDGSPQSHHSSGFDGSSSDGSSYGSSGYPSQFQPSYAGSPSTYAQYSPSQLAAAASQVNSQYASASGTPVTGYQGQASYGGQGPYPAASSTYPQTYAPAADGKSRFYGLGSVIMPLVGLGALAFLLPSVTNLGGKKKTKRSAELNEPSKVNGVADYAERLEKYFKIYRAAVESDDCMNRIVCELGDSVSTVRGKAALLALFEKVAPQWMTGKMGIFKFGALNDKNAKCGRYKC